MKTEIACILLVFATIISADIITKDRMLKFYNKYKPASIRNAVPGQFPYYVYVLPQKLSHNVVTDANLGGVIIDKLWVLTLASAAISAVQFKILFGIVKMSEPPKLTMISKHWVTFPGFDINSQYWQSNDVCLLQLPYELSFTTFIKPITLMPLFLLTSLSKLASCSFEKNYQDSTELPILQWAYFNIIRNSACPKKFICTRVYPVPTKNHFCPWDRGSPLVILNEDTTVTLAGISPGRTSAECDTENYNKEYIKIAYFYDWINKTMSIYPPPKGTYMRPSILKTTTSGSSESSREQERPKLKPKKPKETTTMETKLTTKKSHLSAIETDVSAAEPDLLAHALNFPKVETNTPKKVSKMSAKKAYFDLVTDDRFINYGNRKSNTQHRLANYGHKADHLDNNNSLPTTTKIDLPSAESDLPRPKKLSRPNNLPTSETYVPTAETDVPTAETDLRTAETDLPTSDTEFPTRKTSIVKTKKVSFAKGSKKRKMKFKFDLVTGKTDFPTSKPKALATDSDEDLSMTASTKLPQTATEVSTRTAKTTASDLPTSKLILTKNVSNKTNFANLLFISAENAADAFFMNPDDVYGIVEKYI